MPSPPGDLTTLLSKLASSGVEFVLVGGLAAVAQGAPITTHDVDIVPERTPQNIDALLTRRQPNRSFTPPVTSPKVSFV